MIKSYQKWVMPLARLVAIWIAILTSLLFIHQVNADNSPTLKSFKAEYSAFRFGRDLGYATLELSSDETGQLTLDYYSKVSAFFLSDKRAETSIFSFENNTIIPKTYIYQRTGTGSNKNIGIEFSKENQNITVNNGEPISWNGHFDNQLYRLDAQLKLASGAKEFSYDLINNRGQLRHYDVKVIGQEKLQLPYGMLDSIKVILERDNSSRETIAWFAPKLNYQLVKLQQFKDGDEQGEIRLKKFTFTENKTAQQ
ncbi:DUF3108 domain-containing protein [Paraglaciecola aquimarina]|uniref:DUF3108 domain-containing protein n=1 Tax=Paraglaciecola algarum TaxID=3050085 RepID=A0ABS9D7J8_9ALTE|nr:DUF3108 domain-containing protein [Paraglaciecola sp. G1-23]MCF2948928.1 DUF3108 domain-containing protein [Paraglaciecola sp. G1-23]